MGAEARAYDADLRMLVYEKIDEHCFWFSIPDFQNFDVKRIKIVATNCCFAQISSKIVSNCFSNSKNLFVLGLRKLQQVHWRDRRDQRNELRWIENAK